MSERMLSFTPSDRALEQAIVGLKKGAYILKYGRRGKPKLCPFRLSTDERTLIWFSGKEERQLQLSSVTSIIRGHRTRKLQPERECHSFSLIYMKNQAQCSLDLICRDQDQADSWFLGIKALISRCQDNFCHLDHQKRAPNCINTPTSFIRRKYNLGFHREITKTAQVRNICASPSSIPSLSNISSDSLYSRSSLSSVHNLTDPCLKPENLPKMTAHKPSDVFIWGERFNNGEDALLPMLLNSVSMLDTVNISLAGTRAVLVTKPGEVFCWGEGKSGRVGHRPEEVDGARVKSVSCNEYQTCALTDSGQLYTWSGQLPPRVLDGISVSMVACGDWHTAIVSISGQLFTYGDGTFGVLGHGNCQSLTEPKQVDSLRGMRVKSVACGPWHMAAVVGAMNSSTPAGKLFTWGDGDKGRLGHGNPNTIYKPTCVIALIDDECVQVSCGRMLTVGLTTTGMVYTIGSSVHGQLGNPQARDHSINLVQGKLKFEFVKEIASGSYHVAVLTSKGNVYTWGKGANGQLGIGDTEDRSSPTLVESLKNRKVQSISCGSSSTSAVCLHKSVTFGTDQSGCRGCNKEFGFMKKKHNCYNCGFSFCGMCLAPNKTKSVRLCDSCYKSVSDQMLKFKDYNPRPLLIKTLHEETRDKGPDLHYELGSLVTSRWGRVSFRKEEPLSHISSVCVNDYPQKTRQTSVESTVKRKGAKDVLKALTSRLHSMSPRMFMRNRSKDQLDTPTHVPCHGGNTCLLNELVVKVTGSEQNELKQKPTEWMEQYRPGVYITLVMLPTGQKGIKRVRFSRKVFRAREAESWWEENQRQVYDTYNVDGYVSSF